MRQTLLLVDDHFPLLLSLKQVLRDDYVIEIAENGAEALHKAGQKQYGCIVLDLLMPDMSGLEVCATLRQSGSVVPILVLSAEDGPELKARLLDAGADDYVTKPVNEIELKARLRTIMRRTRQTQSLTNRLYISEVTLDSQRRSVERTGQSVPLRPKEFALLECLMNNAGQVVSRPVLLQYAWRDATPSWEKIVDVHITHLRAKLDTPFERSLIKTVHGFGYKFEIVEKEGA